MYVTKMTEVEVEVDLSDFTTDELVRELENRPDNPFCDQPDLSDLYEALQLGNDERALCIARKLAETFTGRIVTT